MVDELFARGDVQLLMRAMLSLNTQEECKNLLIDICTRTEIEALAQRIEVARLLREGHTYVHIEKATGASTATIGRVKKFLHYGASGYETVLTRIEADSRERKGC